MSYPNRREIDNIIFDEAKRLVNEFFRDETKAKEWVISPNPMLGGISPTEMIVIGKGQRLLDFIKNSLSENDMQDFLDPSNVIEERRAVSIVLRMAQQSLAPQEYEDLLGVIRILCNNRRAFRGIDFEIDYA